MSRKPIVWGTMGGVLAGRTWMMPGYLNITESTKAGCTHGIPIRWQVWALIRDVTFLLVLFTVCMFLCVCVCEFMCLHVSITYLQGGQKTVPDIPGAIYLLKQGL